ncbi:ABC-type nitrate/sulfonate/bicarbonate transport system, permease component [Streptoalloteichus tenebrarius]|uniref:ABC-type nitrate/sulfonate/bicarbonate transport system, permease component n=1 Tax=Streptoalloteichus tenebrarius (strain ATCC 17920 / DSM 40477 / JCM 4838 / CBS 697.72 / NBRC 16177 / NCIMB 11028 / NRRL B-12390 / A12253. 1 / ISP 5477) TaxID=1933 RepID=A0ABT1HVC9_STRSD|nr:ABC transporter permease [Streptoalloteichus tenebrarius]MCP2259489.1 ABC-type nitrate/sulfonate/bicarbonate transport system, permease component [Streptoalloteichus tenebrarius]BFF01431.1 ABC transporter permease [Streptoalloteichus tenebrarius]
MNAKLKQFLQRWGVFAALVVVWELATRAAVSPFFPTPLTILRTMRDQWLSGPASRLFLSDEVFGDVLPSVGRMLGGWALACVIGVAVGVALGRSRVAMDYVGPLLAFARAIPPPMLVPVFLVLLSIGTPMQLATIIFGTLWPVVLNAVDGARAVDSVKVETARVFRLPRHQWLLGVVVPSALPKIFAGVRVSLSLALILMVISELVGATNGIGYQLIYAQRQFDLPTMWAGIVLLGVLGYLFNTLLLAGERRALSWQPAGRG